MTGSTITDAGWSRVGDLAPSSLVDARLQLHHAAQIVVSAAISYLPARSDDSHTALTWGRATRALTSEQIPAPSPIRIALRVEDLTLLAIAESGSQLSSFGLLERTSDEGYTWLAGIVAEAGLDAQRLTSRKHYTIADHPVAHGSPYSPGSAPALRELSRYWSSAAALLDDVARVTPGASDVLTWPHHFDIATLATLPGAARRTIGIGQSPGDDSYAEPYWYVGPNPYPEERNLPPLAAGGHWHTAGWFGAALPATEFVKSADQRAHVTEFIESAVAACRRLLGA